MPDFGAIHPGPPTVRGDISKATRIYQRQPYRADTSKSGSLNLSVTITQGLGYAMHSAFRVAILKIKPLRILGNVLDMLHSPEIN